MRDNEQRVRLLMVDDEAEFLESSACALSRRGFVVHTALDGAKALDVLSEHEFDVVVLDLKMPGMDGDEVFERIHKTSPSTPVIMLTGHGSVLHAFNTSRKGIADYIAKPCDMDELASRIYEVLSLAKHHAGPFKDDTKTGLASVIEVLLVDDEVDFLVSLKNVLQRRSMNVTVAEDAGQALNCLNRSLIEVAIIDVKMPGMDGLALLKIISEDFPNVRAVLLSGHPSASEAVEGIRLGASEYLSKPPNVENLVAIIRRLSRQRQGDITAQQKKLIEEIRSRFPD